MAGYQDRLRDLALSESGFLFDPFSGATYNTNASGRLMLEGLKEGLGRAGILQKLQESFDCSAEGWDLDRDLDEFILLLRENGILPSDFELQP